MGHVDHGKTSLLDAIRATNVAAREYGGITQHTAAYQITFKNRKITFIDTPGHAAFSEMRSRGGKVADIVILVVSVPDGVQPQTVEAIQHAKAAGVPIIVALNKIDLPGAAENLDKVKQQLAEAGILLESYGGDIVSAEVSAKTKQGLDQLLEIVLLVADIAELKFELTAPLEAVVIESKSDAKRGPLASVIVRTGTLTSSQTIYFGPKAFKVKALFDEFNKPVSVAMPGDPVAIYGLGEALALGVVLKDQSSEITTEVKEVPAGLVQEEGSLVLRILLKSDTAGTLEALNGSLNKLSTEEKRVIITGQTVGEINDSDVLLASASGSIILGFNVTANATVLQKAVDLKATIRVYKIIYELLEDVEKLLAGLTLAETDIARGRATVLALFPLPSGDIVAGCSVTKGRLKIGEKVKVLRPEVEAPVFTGRVKNIKEGKKEVELIVAGKECGLLLRPTFQDIKKGDVIEIV